MNAEHKKQIRAYSASLSVIADDLAAIVEGLTEIVSELEETYDAMSETRQDSEKGQALRDQIDDLAAMRDELEGAQNIVAAGLDGVSA